MARLKTFSKEEWKPIATKYSGKTPRYIFDVINSKSEFDSKRVIVDGILLVMVQIN